MPRAELVDAETYSPASELFERRLRVRKSLGQDGTRRSNGSQDEPRVHARPEVGLTRPDLGNLEYDGRDRREPAILPSQPASPRLPFDVSEAERPEEEDGHLPLVHGAGWRIAG